MAKPPLKSVEEKARVVVAILRGEVTTAESARPEGASETTIAKWRYRFLEGGQAAVAAGGRVRSIREQRLEAEIDELTSALGEAHMELRLWRKGGFSTRLRRTRRGTDRRRHDGHPVCVRLGIPRSSWYRWLTMGTDTKGPWPTPAQTPSRLTPRPWRVIGTGGGIANSPS